MPITLNIFVSSTWLDLQPEREAVERTLQKLRTTKFVGMEYFGSRDEDTRRASLSEVDRCQIYVGIFGGRYGSGITEEEYRRARSLKPPLPCLIYLKDEEAISEARRAQELDPLSSYVNSYTCAAYVYAGLPDKALEEIQMTLITEQLIETWLHLSPHQKAPRY